MVNSTILQQVFVVEFVVQNQMCDACHRQAAQDYWKAVVQVRQKVQITWYSYTFFERMLVEASLVVEIWFKMASACILFLWRWNVVKATLQYM